MLVCYRVCISINRLRGRKLKLGVPSLEGTFLWYNGVAGFVFHFPVITPVPL